MTLDYEGSMELPCREIETMTESFVADSSVKVSRDDRKTVGEIAHLGRARLDVQARGVAPQSFQPVEIAGFRLEDVDNRLAVVEEILSCRFTSITVKNAMKILSA